MSKSVRICPAKDIPPGDRKIVSVDGLPYEVGIFNLEGEYYALANVCPHHLAPLCEGRITSEITADKVGEFNVEHDGEIVQCPWHGWKFNIKDGKSVFNPHKLSSRTHEVSTKEASQEGIDEYGAQLQGDEPPIETHDIEVREEFLYLHI